mgnify:CR=1 FL=1|tara:strand:- start:138980 stop:140713 length:1734 start_codon:yes stop_codon:yes gene_type:complete
MLKKIGVVLMLTVLVMACKKENKPKPLNPDQYAEVVNAEFTGDLAYETIAFVAQYWRVVGNTGFNASIYKVAEQLEKMGYVLEDSATAESILTYRIEKRPLERPTWESVDGLVSINNETEPLLEHATNRNMIALNSYSTPKEGVTAEVVYIDDLKNLKDVDVKGKIVFVEANPGRIFKTLVVEGGAVGIVGYSNPEYLQPAKNITSIQFRSIPLDEEQKGWAIALSYAAKERLKAKLALGKVTLNVNLETKIYPSEELTIVAEVKGAELPEQRLVFSAHVQEPGANDNASGVGVALEMASVTAKLVNSGQLTPKRTLTFLWGDEMISTRRYVQEDSIRAKDIKWGISLDMVGENTELTGGTFLIEKMPDPSAIWTRGNDKHTEWGGRKMKLEDMKPHYLNDFLIKTFKAQGKRAQWQVETNPFEGGSDHVPFLYADIPSVLFWHFTDQFYHTDNDRIDKVSKTTLKNVGTAALIGAYSLLNADEVSAKMMIADIEIAAVNRLNEELRQSEIALKNGDSLVAQLPIINAWKEWYTKAVATTNDMVNDTILIQPTIKKSQAVIEETANEILNQLNAAEA